MHNVDYCDPVHDLIIFYIFPLATPFLYAKRYGNEKMIWLMKNI